MARRLPVSADQRDDFFRALRAGADRETAAAHASADYWTLTHLIEIDFEFGLEVARAEADFRISQRAAIARDAKGDWRAAAWLADPLKATVRNPAAMCEYVSKRTGLPCGNWKGQGTDHPGVGGCRNHWGTTKSGRAHAQTEARMKAALDLFLSLSLSQIANGLARDAAARALATDPARSEDYARNVGAFARAAERAEGSKITIEGRLQFLQQLTDDEVEAAHAEIKRLLAEARGEQAPA